MREIITFFLKNQFQSEPTITQVFLHRLYLTSCHFMFAYAKKLIVC